MIGKMRRDSRAAAKRNGAGTAGFEWEPTSIACPSALFV